jgi:hypothetical protein
MAFQILSSMLITGILLILIIITVQYLQSRLLSLETFQNPGSQDYRGHSAYKQQAATVATRFKGISGRRRALDSSMLSDDEQCLVNYTALGNNWIHGTI